MKRGNEHPAEWLMLVLAIGVIGAMIFGGL